MKKILFGLIITLATIINSKEVVNENIKVDLNIKTNEHYLIKVVNKAVGNLDVSTHDQNNIIIDILKESDTKERLQKLEIKLNEINQTYFIKAINNNKEIEKNLRWEWWPGCWFNFNNYTVNNKNDRIDLKIKIPKSCMVNVNINNGDTELENIDQSITIKSNLGSININKANDSVLIDSNNGTLNLTNIKGNLRIRSDLGSIQVSNLDKELDAKITNGDISIQNAHGPLTVAVTNGSINLHQAKIQNSGTIDFDTTVGSINLILPTKQNAILDAKATIGSIFINKKKTGSRLKVGNSFKGSLLSNIDTDLKIFLRTTTGSINVSNQQ